jgi:adenine-specific DNA-methyltransferase
MKVSDKLKTSDVKMQELKVPLSAQDLFNNQDPYASIQSGKIMARAWANGLPETDHIHQAQTFILKVIEEYWSQSHQHQKIPRRLPFLFKKVVIKNLDKSVDSVAQAIGAAAAKLPIIEGSYLLGTVYTSVLPASTRTVGGVFYTPPSLTRRLIDLAEKAGVNWSTANIIDPACGGGAFLAPICLRILASIKDRDRDSVLNHIQTHLTGWEIDPFAGWLSQVFIEVALKDLLNESSFQFQPVVKICDSLTTEIPAGRGFDLVIGNPPYGKLKLTEPLKDRFHESLYGHPNLYGVFTHLALELCASNGIVAYLTPTSFLSGQYFKRLRGYLRKHSFPIEIDFVSVRKGVFDDVLQETMLAVYKKKPYLTSSLEVNQITTLAQNKLSVFSSGRFTLPSSLTAPWILPRKPQQGNVVCAMQRMTCQLADWGYQVSTGPLVWNRHKSQLTDSFGKNTYTLIWAEAITSDGKFVLKSEKVNHKAYFRFKTGDDWLISNRPCILLQRTTAKEQDKRLIAAPLPEHLRKKGVVIENHLNMIIAIDKKPVIAPHVLSIFLNSMAVNEAFRSISGSVAISAYELEALPLPRPEQLNQLVSLVSRNADQQQIEQSCHQLYSLLV